MYVSDLQREFYQDKKIIAKEYNSKMESISEIVDVLHLKIVSEDNGKIEGGG